MCGRFVISSENVFGLEYKASFNIVPSQMVPVKTINDAKLMKWTYAPLWKKDMNLINCRSETMNEKPSFKNAKRCVIYHNGWYEWQRKDNQKIPFYHHCPSNSFAGLYNEIGCLIVTRGFVSLRLFCDWKDDVAWDLHVSSPLGSGDWLWSEPL